MAKQSQYFLRHLSAQREKKREKTGAICHVSKTTPVNHLPVFLARAACSCLLDGPYIESIGPPFQSFLYGHSSRSIRSIVLGDVAAVFALASACLAKVHGLKASAVQLEAPRALADASSFLNGLSSYRRVIWGRNNISSDERARACLDAIGFPIISVENRNVRLVVIVIDWWSKIECHTLGLIDSRLLVHVATDLYSIARR